MKVLFSNRVVSTLRLALACWFGMVCMLMPMLHTHAHHAPLKSHACSDEASPDGHICSRPGDSAAQETSGGSHFCFACHWLKNLSKVAVILPDLGWTPLISSPTYEHTSSPAAYSRSLAIDARAPPMV